METNNTVSASRKKEWYSVPCGLPMPGLPAGLALEDPFLTGFEASPGPHPHLLGSLGESFPLSKPQLPHL